MQAFRTQTFPFSCAPDPKPKSLSCLAPVLLKPATHAICQMREKLPPPTREGLFRERASPSRHREKRNSSSAGIPRDAQGCSSHGTAHTNASHQQQQQQRQRMGGRVREREREAERKRERERERGNETQQRGAAHSEAARHITSLLSTPEEAELWRGERRHSPLHLLSDNVRTCRGKIHCNHLKLLLWNGLSSD